MFARGLVRNPDRTHRVTLHNAGHLSGFCTIWDFGPSEFCTGSHIKPINIRYRNDQNDLQLISSQIKDVAYSKELEQEIHNNENMNCDMYFPQLSVQQMYNLNNKFRNGHQLNGISEQLEDFTIDDKE
ncbi:5647_t:CDS:2 [Rhizophagus irregularis]|nr:5647_t:CDS:2 [Rhizophagus irregularis]